MIAVKMFLLRFNLSIDECMEYLLLSPALSVHFKLEYVKPKAFSP